MLRFHKYRSPFKHPFITSAGTFNYREGIILSIKSDSFTAFGEVAPLPGFSEESLADVLTVLIQNKKFLEQAFLNDDAKQLISVLDQIHGFLSLSFGLDTLLHDFNAKKKGIPFSELLFEEKEISVPCNATIGSLSFEEALDLCREKVSDGFGTIKLKVGIDFELELEIISKIRDSYPELNIRIDANQAWDLEEAISNLSKLESYGIEYCEEPLKNPDSTSLSTLKSESIIKLATDENVRNIRQVREVTAQNNYDVIIIKPALMGLFDNANVTKVLSDTHNRVVVFTTSFDGVIGRIATAVLASGLGSRNYAHGLATGSFLVEQGVGTKQVKNGVFSVSEQSGLGYPVDLSHLEEIK